MRNYLDGLADEMLDILFVIMVALSVFFFVYGTGTLIQQGVEASMIVKWKSEERKIEVHPPTEDTMICIDLKCRKAKDWIDYEEIH